MSLESRLDKLAAALAVRQPPQRDIVRRTIDGVDDPEALLGRMVANREITEEQRGDVRFIRRTIIEPIWETDADGNSRFVGRRNVHTGEVEPVEGSGDT